MNYCNRCEIETFLHCSIASDLDIVDVYLERSRSKREIYSYLYEASIIVVEGLLKTLGRCWQHLIHGVFID